MCAHLKRMQLSQSIISKRVLKEMSKLKLWRNDGILYVNIALLVWNVIYVIVSGWNELNWLPVQQKVWMEKLLWLHCDWNNLQSSRYCDAHQKHVDLVSTGFHFFPFHEEPITFMTPGRLSWRRLQNLGDWEVHSRGGRVIGTLGSKWETCKAWNPELGGGGQALWKKEWATWSNFVDSGLRFEMPMVPKTANLGAPTSLPTGWKPLWLVEYNLKKPLHILLEAVIGIIKSLKELQSPAWRWRASRRIMVLIDKDVTFCSSSRLQPQLSVRSLSFPEDSRLLKTPRPRKSVQGFQTVRLLLQRNDEELALQKTWNSTTVFVWGSHGRSGTGPRLMLCYDSDNDLWEELLIVHSWNVYLSLAVRVNVQDRCGCKS